MKDPLLPLLPKLPLLPGLPAAEPAPKLLEEASPADEGTPKYGDFGHPATEPAPVLPPEHRAEGGNVFDLTNQQTTH